MSKIGTSYQAKKMGEILDERGQQPFGLGLGEFIMTSLPSSFDRFDLLVCVPAYRRQSGASTDQLGTLPLLLKDTVDSANREGLRIAIIVSDDSPASDAARNGPALRAALAHVPASEVPPILFFGRPERESVFERSKHFLSDSLRGHLQKLGESSSDGDVAFHLSTMKFLLTNGGYGPQRVRLQGLTAGFSQNVLSNDSDLARVGISPMAHQSFGLNSFNANGHQLVFVERSAALATEVSPVNEAYLKAAAEAPLGRTIGEIQRRQLINAYSSVVVDKDPALRLVTEGKPFAPFGLHPSGQIKDGQRDVLCVAAMGYKYGYPDVNGREALLNAIKEGGSALSAFAFPLHGASDPFLVIGTPNPDCAVQTSSSRSRLLMVPWLTSLGRFSGPGGQLLETGVRAEDALNARNENFAVMYTPHAYLHLRDVGGRDENAVQTFLSEDMGDILAALVRRRLRFDEGMDMWRADLKDIYDPVGSYPTLRGNVKQEVGEQLKLVWERISGVRASALESFSRATSHDHRQFITSCLEELDARTGTCYDDFERIAEAYLARQTQFVDSVLTVYPLFLDFMERQRSSGGLPVLSFVKG